MLFRKRVSLVFKIKRPCFWIILARNVDNLRQILGSKNRLHFLEVVLQFLRKSSLFLAKRLIYYPENWVVLSNFTLNLVRKKGALGLKSHFQPIIAFWRGGAEVGKTAFHSIQFHFPLWQKKMEITFHFSSIYIIYNETKMEWKRNRNGMEK